MQALRKQEEGIMNVIIYCIILALYVAGCVAGITAGCSKRTIAALLIVSLFGMVQLYA